ncbi:MAG TPA: CBS domain-containing protein, partial [Vicinamibacteria bacterium]|nr:CBS domain-containing protein [Vicinamibacteria bacterium]
MRTLGDVVSGRELYFAKVDQSVRDVARYMSERRVGAVAVMDGDRLAGIVSERDLMGRVVAPGRDPEATLVADVMTRELVFARKADTHEEGLRRMKQAGCRHLPVVE